jgi:hypothetical protein
VRDPNIQSMTAGCEADWIHRGQSRDPSTRADWIRQPLDIGILSRRLRSGEDFTNFRPRRSFLEFLPTGSITIA